MAWNSSSLIASGRNKPSDTCEGACFVGICCGPWLPREWMQPPGVEGASFLLVPKPLQPPWVTTTVFVSAEDYILGLCEVFHVRVSWFESSSFCVLFSLYVCWPWILLLPFWAGPWWITGHKQSWSLSPKGCINSSSPGITSFTDKLAYIILLKLGHFQSERVPYCICNRYLLGLSQGHGDSWSLLFHHIWILNTRPVDPLFNLVHVEVRNKSLALGAVRPAAYPQSASLTSFPLVCSLQGLPIFSAQEISDLFGFQTSLVSKQLLGNLCVSVCQSTL